MFAANVNKEFHLFKIKIDTQKACILCQTCKYSQTTRKAFDSLKYFVVKLCVALYSETALFKNFIHVLQKTVLQGVRSKT